MRTISLIMMALCLLWAAPAQAQGHDYGGALPALGLSSTHVIDSPAASILRHGAYRFSGRMMASGSLVARTEVGIKDRFSVGISWGMQGLLGRGDVVFNENTAISLRLLLVEEMHLPAILIGFDNQGYGPWDEELRRYERKSKGFYAVMTRNWYGPLGSDVATTVGANYSMEGEDEQSVDAFFGLEQDFGNQIALLVDYSLGLNDREREDPPEFGEGKGWLDLGMRWNIQEHIQFKFFFRDLLANFEEDGRINRQFLITYEGNF